MQDLTSLYTILRHPAFSHEERMAWLHEAASLDTGTLKAFEQELQKQRDLTIELSEAIRQQVMSAGGSAQVTVALTELSTFLRDHLFEGATPVLCGFLLDQLIQEGRINEVKMFTETLKDAIRSNPTLQAEAPHLVSQYEAIVLRAQWYRFMHLPDDEVDTLLRTKFCISLVYGLDVRGAIDERLDFYHDFIQLGDERKRLIRSLRENEEWIGYLPLLVQGGDAETQPTLKQWFLDYERFFSERKIRGDIDRVTYINTAQNPKKLDEHDREFYLNVLALYDYLLFPPQIYTTTRAVQPRSGIPNRMPPVPSRQQMTQLLNETPEEKRMRDALGQIMISEVAKSGKSQEEIFNSLCQKMSPLSQDEQRRVVVLVRLFAQEGKLKEALLSEPLVQSITARAPNTRSNIVTRFRFILITIAGMSEHDSARFAGQCGAWLKKAGVPEFQRMVYFDAREQAFLWS